METRNQSNFVLVLACFGVVLYHLLGNEELYIGDAGLLSLETIKTYYLSNGFFYALFECFKGSTGIVGLFLINSGYGLYKTSRDQTPAIFLKKRFTKIWLYSLLCGILSTLIVLVAKGEFIYSYIFSLIPVFGFYEMPREGLVVQYWYLSLIFIYYLLFPYIRKVIDAKLFVFIVLFSAFIGYLIIFEVYTSTSVYHSVLCRLSEFCFGILLAKNQKTEQYFFRFKFMKIGIALFIAFVGYYMFYDVRFVPFSFLFYSVGVYFLGVQIAALFVSNVSVAKLFSKLKGGTMSVYLIHLIIFPTMVKISMRIINLFVEIENSYIISFVIILFITFLSLLFFNIIETHYYKISGNDSANKKADKITIQHLMHMFHIRNSKSKSVFMSGK